MRLRARIDAYQNLKIGTAPLRAFTFETRDRRNQGYDRRNAIFEVDRERMKDLTHTFLWAIPITVLICKPLADIFLRSKKKSGSRCCDERSNRIASVEENLHERCAVAEQT